MKKIVYIIIVFYIYMFITDIFALQVERFDEHIQSEELRNSYIYMRIQLILSSGLTVLMFFTKRYKLSIFFGIVFIVIILFHHTHT